jgi:hypothetical protein
MSDAKMSARERKRVGLSVLRRPLALWFSGKAPLAPVPEKPPTSVPDTEYSPPTLARRTPQQASLFLVGHASIGDRGAQELLEAMFPLH